MTRFSWHFCVSMDSVDRHFHSMDAYQDTCAQHICHSFLENVSSKYFAHQVSLLVDLVCNLRRVQCITSPVFFVQSKTLGKTKQLDEPTCGWLWLPCKFPYLEIHIPPESLLLQHRYNYARQPFDLGRDVCWHALYIAECLSPWQGRFEAKGRVEVKSAPACKDTISWCRVYIRVLLSLNSSFMNPLDHSPTCQILVLFWKVGQFERLLIFTTTISFIICHTHKPSTCVQCWPEEFDPHTVMNKAILLSLSQ